MCQNALHVIWNQNPATNTYISVIQNSKVYHGSFHSLKGNEYLNDEVSAGGINSSLMHL